MVSDNAAFMRSWNETALMFKMTKTTTMERNRGQRKLKSTEMSQSQLRTTGCTELSDATNVFSKIECYDIAFYPCFKAWKRHCWYTRWILFNAVLLVVQKRYSRNGALQFTVAASVFVRHSARWVLAVCPHVLLVLKILVPNSVVLFWIFLRKAWSGIRFFNLEFYALYFFSR